MKALVLILAFVAYTYAANGVSSYQSTLGTRRSSITSGSGGLVQSSGVNQRQNVQQISTAPQLAARGPEVAQKKSGRVIIIPQSAPSPTVRPISSSLSKSSVQPVRTVQVAPQKISTSINQQQTVRQVSTGISNQQNARPVSYSQPIVTAQPVRTVQVVPQKISTPINLNQGQTQVNYGSNSGISKQQNVRPVSYSQQPVVTAQPVQKVQVVPQKISTPVNLNQGQSVRQVSTVVSNQQNVRPVSYAQPLVAAQPVRTVQVVPQKVSTPINLNQGQAVNSGISNQQSVRPVSYSQKPVKTVQVVPQKVSTPVRPASYSQPIVAAQPVRSVQVVPQKPINLNQGQIQVNSGISKQQNVRPVSYSQPTSTVQPVRTVQVVPQKITTSINQQQTSRQVNTGISNQQNVRPVSYTQPKATVQPVVTAQPVRTVQVVPQKISTPVRPASYSQPIVAPQPVQNVQVVSQKISTQNQGQTQVNYGSNSGISNQQNERPIAYSQPTVRPVSNLQSSVRPVSYSQPIVTAERARTIQVAPQKISASPINQGLNVNQVSYSNNQQQLRPVSYSQPQVTVQPVQTVQVVPQQIVSSSPINLGGVSYGSGIGLNQGQAVQRVNYNQQTVRPISYSQQTITSQPIQTVQQVSQPIVYTQTLPIRTIKLAPQQIISQSFPQQYQISSQPINLNYGQPIRQVSLLQPQLASNLAGTNYAYTQPSYTNYGGNIGQDQYYILGKKK